MAVDGRLKFDTKIDTGGFNKGVDGIKQSCSSMMNSFKKIGASVGVAFGVGAVVQFSKASIKASNDIENAMIGLKSILDGQGRDFQQADKFMQAYISDGLIPATEAVTAYKNLAMRGYTDPQIQSTLLALKDSAAFGRQASLTLGQAVAGATEGLKNENSILVDNAGVTKNVSMMWADYAKSIGVGVAQLTKEQKIQAEVLGVMEETRFQTGDAAKVADTYSGSILKLQFGMNNAKIAFGNFIKPIIASVIPVINAAIETFTRFFNVMSQVSALLFGKKVFAEEQAQKQENALGGAVQNEKDLAKATEKANKASKKQLSDFDKIHVLARETADSIDTGSGNIPTGGGTGNTIGSTVEVSPKVAQAVEKIRAMLEPLRKTIEYWIEAFSRLLTTLNTVLQVLAPLGRALWENFLKPIAEWTGGKFIEWLHLLTFQFDKITAWLQSNQELFDRFAATIGRVTSEIWALLKPIADTVWGSFMGMIDIIVDVVLDLAQSFTEVAKKIGDALLAVIGFLDSIGVLDFIQAAIQTNITYIGNAFRFIVQVIGNVIGTVIERLGFCMDFITAVFTGDWKAAWQAVVNTFKSSFDAIGKIFSNLWTFFSNTFDAFSRNFQGVWEGIWRGIGNFFIGIWNGIVKAFESAINWIIGGINSIIDTINSVIDLGGGLLNKIGINIELSIPTIPSVSLPTIPHLARGAVIPPNREFMAVLGDQRTGTNIEAPLDTMVQAFKMASADSGSNEIVIKFTGALSELVRILKPELDKESNRKGTRLVMG